MKLILRTLVLLVACVFASKESFSQVPVLNSDPTAAPTIYLDFDGQYVSGTSWNWGGPIAAEAANLSADQIREIFVRVAEDYRPFMINVTTDSTRFLKAPIKQRMRVIVTSTSSWYGRAGGVAFVGSFSWGDDTPTWIFSTLLQNNAKYISEACAHEAGHSLGLQHQSLYDENCAKKAEYNPGTGDGEIGWAPIMGVGYYQNLTTWHTGPTSEGCHVIQNDLSVITSAANGVVFRTDDFGNSPQEAAPIVVQGSNFQVKGQITKTKDVDAFKLVLNSQNSLRLTAIPNNVGAGNQGADVDLKIFIMNSSLDTIGTYNPSRLLDAIIDTSLNKGVYYISIGATGNAYHSEYGSLGDYSLAGSLQSILPINEFVLKANDEKGSRTLSWNYISDEKVEGLLIETSVDGRNFMALSTVSANRSNYRFLSTGSAAYYRMKATTFHTQQTYYSNIIHIDGNHAPQLARVLGTVISGTLKVNSNGAYAYQVMDMSGARLAAGKLSAGVNSLDATRFPKGMLLLQVNDGLNNFTEKLIKE